MDSICENIVNDAILYPLLVNNPPSNRLERGVKGGKSCHNAAKCIFYNSNSLNL